MTGTNMLLIAVCGMLGFGIIWNVLGSKGKD